jgi:NAD(P)-dependent dehydrogenase (short-subunit alcohol dehydrogenase family)
MNSTAETQSPAKAWVITGPTSGIGRRTALELAQHGTVVLVGRDPSKLAEVEAEIQAQVGGRAVSATAHECRPSEFRAGATAVPPGHAVPDEARPVRFDVDRPALATSATGSSSADADASALEIRAFRVFARRCPDARPAREAGLPGQRSAGDAWPPSWTG